jgi:hypothetical protein
MLLLLLPLPAGGGVMLLLLVVVLLVYVVSWLRRQHVSDSFLLWRLCGVRRSAVSSCSLALAYNTSCKQHSRMCHVRCAKAAYVAHARQQRVTINPGSSHCLNMHMLCSWARGRTFTCRL